MTLVAVVGDVALDVVAAHAGPLAVGDDTPARVRTGPGGQGATTARELARLGVPTVLLGRVGDDATGRALRDGLAADGVRCRLAVDPGAPTGCVVVLVDGRGERTMLPDRGANSALEPADVALPPGTTHVHLSGYVLLDPASRAAGLAALAAARAAGAATSVDPSSAALVAGCGADAVLGWLRGVDLLLPNAAELAALGPRVPDVVGAVAVTRGTAGASWLRAGSPAVDVAAPALAVADSTGAGDAFDAGVLAAWSRGAAPADALRAGVAAAADLLGRRSG